MMSDGIAGDEVVTQYVFAKTEPQDAPRPRDMDGLSVLRGRVAILVAARYVRTKVGFPFAGDSVRFASVERLRSCGFVVTLSPSNRIPIHVSVSIEAEWDPDVCQRFNSCFEEVRETWEGGGQS
jgi:hypothetical protein